MERTIDRTSYRRNAKNEISTVKEKEVKERKFSYIKIFLNQIIVSLLIIIAILTAKYFDISIIDEWIVKNMSEGYELKEILNLAKNMFSLNKDNINMINTSGDESISGENFFSISGDLSGDSGDNVFITAVEGINQMLDDAKFVKENYEFILPVNGVVTSDFGCRVSDDKIVSSYHTGLDIGANTGTRIYAAHAGTITMAENFSSYGKCIMIENGDLISVYAHCSSLNVSKGQKVNKGDFIGKVGMTGNATGPHLHLEIKYQGRFVDPKDIFGEI